MDKISDNLALIKSNNKDLRSYLTHIGSKRDSKMLNDQINQTLSINGGLFMETTQLISEFKQFVFPNKNDKATNMKQLKLMESSSNQLKTEFDSITYKISRQNKSYIDSQRSSRLSMPKIQENDKQMELFVQGDDLLAEGKLEAKEKAIEIITK